MTTTAYRLSYQPQLPACFNQLREIVCKQEIAKPISQEIQAAFPHVGASPYLQFKQGEHLENFSALRVGVVLSGGQAPGGHNVITGLYDALQQLNANSKLFGFLNGPSGILKENYVELTAAILHPYRNQGGFDLLGSDRTKIETEEQLAKAAETMQNIRLDGLVVIGGDDSNTNAAFLAEYFLQKGLQITVVGVPKTIDGDLKNAFIETSFGFDTAAKTYAAIIGNICRDTLSAKKAYYFIKMMGRSASHITLECALQTQPNAALIGEELAAKGTTLAELTGQLADIISKRAEAGKHYGVFLIPEGIIEFIPECKGLIAELNRLTGESHPREKLSLAAQQCWDLLPKRIQEQLLLDRDPHGNVQVSKIETERLLIDLVEKELKKRADAGTFQGKPSFQPHFCGYEGRSCAPSNFDANYCYALGFTSALLAAHKATGYIAALCDLTKPASEWLPQGIPLVQLMGFEERKGKRKAVVSKALVDLEGRLFKRFAENRESWVLDDAYLYPGPIQFFGPPEITDAVTLTLQLH